VIQTGVIKGTIILSLLYKVISSKTHGYSMSFKILPWSCISD